jgi:cyclopropane fatty-acyl-phospholipid synthase-like methyltransferase
MPNPLIDLIQKYAGADLLPRMKQHALGLAEDFWKDGTEDPFAFTHKLKAKKAEPAKPATAKVVEAPPLPIWHAEAGEIAEKMWGKGCTTPSDKNMNEALIGPLGLTKSMSILDLSAGLGGRMIATADKYGVYMTGLEADEHIAMRGMENLIHLGKNKQLAISPYDPATLSLTKTYDVIIAREVFYRVSDKASFFATIGEYTKPKAQLVFTDYIVNPEDRESGAVEKWRAGDKQASPISLVEMAEGWAKAGFTLRVHEDQTALYKKEVFAGLKRFAAHLASGARPDAETKKAIIREMQSWVQRMAAMDQGLKFYRFYGSKQ